VQEPPPAEAETEFGRKRAPVKRSSKSKPSAEGVPFDDQIPWK
jgi:hypothetical protein